MKQTVIVRAEKNLLEEYINRHPETKGLTYSGVASVMLRRALQEGEKKSE